MRGVSIILDVLLQALLPIRQKTHNPVVGYKTAYSQLPIRQKTNNPVVGYKTTYSQLPIRQKTNNTCKERLHPKRSWDVVNSSRHLKCYAP